MEETELVISVARAGELLGISRPTAYLLAKRGQIPTLRLGRRLVVPKAALQRMLEACKPTDMPKEETPTTRSQDTP